MSEQLSRKAEREATIAYTLHGNRYLNITYHCTLRCAFCPKFNGTWVVQDYDLRLYQEPSVEEILAAAGDPADYNEYVFCGLGEPTLRLEVLLEVARRLKAQGAQIRINTDGLANLVHGRDVTPEMEGLVDSLSVSLNAQDEFTYNRHCRPKQGGAFDAVLDFLRRAREHVPEVTVTAIDGLEGVDIAACERIAQEIGVGFRRRVLDVVG
ncbi:MAG TPA: TatD family nuclease-associated radical SAM protein [Gammaproteobacteria bacterium]|nr:TatD family nuclease-associated radical SAM protein [Gammaproteobacteria bacterium]